MTETKDGKITVRVSDEMHRAMKKKSADLKMSFQEILHAYMLELTEGSKIIPIDESMSKSRKRLHRIIDEFIDEKPEDSDLRENTLTAIIRAIIRGYKG